VGELEELLHDVVLVAPQQVDEPGALGRLAQFADLTGEGLLARRSRLADFGVARR
jgi:hypothetical protein